MILDVTMLVTSAQLGNATEAFGVLAGGGVAAPSTSISAPATASAEQLAWSALLQPSPDAGIGGGERPRPSMQRVALDQVEQLAGAELFAQLGLRSTAELDRLSRDPRIVSALLADPPSASATATTWRLMPGSSRKALVEKMPRLVGNLEGIPYRTRDEANRADLSGQIAGIRKRLDSGAGRAASDELRAELHMLQQVQKALEPTRGIPRELIALNTAGEGTAVISIGELDTADYVSYLVPGMFYGVDSRLVPWTGIAADLAADQRSWLNRLGRGDQRAAVLSWIGYQTPSLVDVASMSDAREGSAALSASLRGLTTARSARPPYVSVLAHSYGATAALLALESGRAGPRVDALAMVGSPGSPAQDVGELAVTEGNVWVGAARWDPISQSGVFGSQPTSSAYGARRMGVDGGTDPVTSERLAGTVSHNDYFTPGSETLRNFALIGIDANEYVLQPGGRMLAAG